MKLSRKSVAVIAIAFLIVTSLAIIVYAQPMLRGGAAGRGVCRELAFLQNPQVKEKLELTDDQIKAIKEASEEIDKKMIELKAKLEVAKIELRSLLDADTINKSAIDAKIEELGKIKTEMLKSTINRKIVMKEILTSEQQEKIKEFIGNNVRQRIKDRQAIGNRPASRQGRGQRQGYGMRGNARGGARGGLQMRNPNNQSFSPGMGVGPQGAQGQGQRPFRPGMGNWGALETNPDVPVAPAEIGSEEQVQPEDISFDEIQEDELFFDEDNDDLAFLLN